MSTENINDIELREVLTENSLKYGYSISLARSVPALEDGLKPIHRRIMYSLSLMNSGPNAPLRKAARIIGDVIGRFHPHGDTSAYDAMVSMSAPWITRVPLIDFQGNKGSITGDKAAAMRYTEARLSKISTSFLDDLKTKQVVEWKPTYNQEEDEPILLPVMFPNILVNGTTGIAWGYSTDIPPHNPKKVIEATRAYLSNKDIKEGDLIKLIGHPDFPTGGVITNKSELPKIYETGRGIISLRAKYELDTDGHYVRITEMPYSVSIEKFIKRIDELVRVEKNNIFKEHISNVLDFSNRKNRPHSTDVDIRIFVKKKSDLEFVTRLLLKHSLMSTSVKCNFVLVDDGKINSLNLKDIISKWVDFRLKTLYKRTNKQFNHYQNQIHRQEGYIKVIATEKSLDATVSHIRAASSKADAKERLIKYIDLSPVQADAILDMPLSRLTKLGIDEIKAKLVELQKQVEYLITLLTEEGKMEELMDEELAAVPSLLPKELLDMRTVAEDSTVDTEVIIEPGTSFITLSMNGYIRRVNIDQLKAQKRGGKGKTGIKVRKTDSILSTLTCANEDTLILLTDTGRAFKMISGQLSDDTLAVVGTHLSNYIPLLEDETIIKIVPVTQEQVEATEGLSLALITNTGKIKKTSLDEYLTNRSTGLIAITLEEDSFIVDGCLVTEEDSVILLTSNGFCVHFDVNTIRTIARASKGQGGVVLRDGDSVISIVPITPKTDGLITVTDEGYCKLAPMENYPKKSVYTKGYRVIPTGKHLNGALTVEDDLSDCLVTTFSGKAIRFDQTEIRALKGRATLGVKVVTLEEDDNVLNVCMFPSDV